jgi:hypothetical protein
MCVGDIVRASRCPVAASPHRVRTRRLQGITGVGCWSMPSATIRSVRGNRRAFVIWPGRANRLIGDRTCWPTPRRQRVCPRPVNAARPQQRSVDYLGVTTADTCGGSGAARAQRREPSGPARTCQVVARLVSRQAVTSRAERRYGRPLATHLTGSRQMRTVGRWSRPFGLAMVTTRRTAV